MRTITTVLLLWTVVLTVSLATEPDNARFIKEEALLRQCEPDLSMYSRHIGAVAVHGSHCDVYVTYQLKPNVKTNSASLRLYAQKAFQSANWTNGLPSDIKSEMRSPSGEVIKPIGFHKQPFQPKPGDYAPEYVTVYFLDGGTNLHCTYVFRCTSEAQQTSGGNSKPRADTGLGTPQK